MLPINSTNLKRKLLSLLFALFTYWLVRYFRKTGVSVHYSNAKFKAFLESAKSLKSRRFYPHPFFWFSLAQSWASLKFALEKVQSLVHTREAFEYTSGGTGHVEWINFKDREVKFNPDYIAFILPGLRSKPDDGYLQDLYCKLLRSNIRTVLFVPRFNDYKFQLPKNKKIDLVEDIREGFLYVKSKFPDAKFITIGHSYGANAIVNYLAKYNEDKSIVAAVSVANPFSFPKGSAKIKGTIIDQFLTTGLKHIAEANSEDFPNHPEHEFSLPTILKKNTTREIDDMYTCKILGYKDSNEYYDDISCGQRVLNVKVPLLVINAEDDAFIDPTGLPLDAHKQNENLMFVVSKGGGHIGWVQGIFRLTRWFTPVIDDYVRWVVESA